MHIQTTVITQPNAHSLGMISHPKSGTSHFHSQCLHNCLIVINTPVIRLWHPVGRHLSLSLAQTSGHAIKQSFHDLGNNLLAQGLMMDALRSLGMIERQV